jgi:hypothetical protein
MGQSSELNEILPADVACLSCGYNLRGLTNVGVCPECGTAVAASLRGDFLKYADPAWLERLKLGTSLKLWHIVLSILVGFFFGILAGLGFNLPPILAELIGLAGVAIGLWASFSLTAQEPRVAMMEDPITLRKIIRICAALVFIGKLISVLGHVPFVPALAVLVGVALSMAGVVSGFGELMLFRRYALRIPDAPLAGSAKGLMWLFPISLAAVILGVLLAVIMAATTTSGGPSTMAMTPFAILGCFGGLAMLIAGLWYVRLLTKLRKAFAAALAEARTTTAGVAEPSWPLQDHADIQP